MKSPHYALTLLLAAAAPVFAQAPSTAPSAGLDALSDDRLYTELADRGQTKLLERAFETNKVPPARQAGIRSLVALR